MPKAAVFASLRRQTRQRCSICSSAARCRYLVQGNARTGLAELDPQSGSSDSSWSFVVFHDPPDAKAPLGWRWTVESHGHSGIQTPLWLVTFVTLCWTPVFWRKGLE